MVENIKKHGVWNPVIMRKMHYGYEMLSGHNRQNAAKLAGLKQIPAFVKKNLPYEDAYVYVIETNLMQRSLTDLTVSEKAAVLTERIQKAKMTGKDIREAIAGPDPEINPLTGDAACIIFHKHKYSHPYHRHERGNSLR